MLGRATSVEIATELAAARDDGKRACSEVRAPRHPHPGYRASLRDGQAAISDDAAMRSSVLALALSTSACGGDDGGLIDIHALVACDQAWTRNGYNECEAACVNSTIALNAMGIACQAHTSAGTVSCSKTFEFQGVTGCCASHSPQVLFGECD